MAYLRRCHWIRTRFGKRYSSANGIQLTASAFCLYLSIHCGRVAECHLPHGAMSAGGHLRLPRLPIEEGLLHATPQLLFAASTPQALSVSELHKRLSCASTFKGKITAQSSRSSSDESSQPKLWWCLK